MGCTCSGPLAGTLDSLLCVITAPLKLKGASVGLGAGRCVAVDSSVPARTLPQWREQQAGAAGGERAHQPRAAVSMHGGAVAYDAAGTPSPSLVGRHVERVPWQSHVQHGRASTSAACASATALTTPLRGNAVAPAEPARAATPATEAESKGTGGEAAGAAASASSPRWVAVQGSTRRMRLPDARTHSFIQRVLVGVRCALPLRSQPAPCQTWASPSLTQVRRSCVVAACAEADVDVRGPRRLTYPLNTRSADGRDG